MRCCAFVWELRGNMLWVNWKMRVGENKTATAMLYTIFTSLWSFNTQIQLDWPFSTDYLKMSRLPYSTRSFIFCDKKKKIMHTSLRCHSVAFFKFYKYHISLTFSIIFGVYMYMVFTIRNYKNCARDSCVHTEIVC